MSKPFAEEHVYAKIALARHSLLVAVWVGRRDQSSERRWNLRRKLINCLKPNLLMTKMHVMKEGDKG